MTPHRVGKILDHYLTRTGMQQKIREQRIMDAWEGIVGKAVAEMTHPVRIRDSVLQVKVSNSVWMNELQFHKKLILRKLNDYLGNPVLQDLWFMIGEKEGGMRPPEDRGKQKPGREARELGQEDKDRIERELSPIKDPEIKEILFRVFSKGFALEKGRAGIYLGNSRPEAGG